MKTKHLFGLVTVVVVTGFAASAQAGWSVGIAFPAPVLFPPPVVVTGPRCLPPVVVCPPSVVYRPVPKPCRPVVYFTPRCAPYYGHGDYRALYREHRGWEHADRSHDRGNRR